MAIVSSHAGHGGRKTGNSWADPGAVGSGYQEADVGRTINSKIAALTRCADTTDNAGANANAILENVSANINARADGWHISNHLNAFNGSATGVEVLYGSPAYASTAAAMSKAIADVLGLPNRGAKDGSWLYIANSTGAGKKILLIEWCFIDNPANTAKLLASMDNAVKAALNVLGYNFSGAEAVEENPVKAYLDAVGLNSKKLNVSGWLLHKRNSLAGSVPWVFLIDKKTNREVKRIQASWKPRSDVAKVHSNPASDKVGISIEMDTPAELLKGNDQFKIMFRASDSSGNKSLAEHWFNNEFSEVPEIDEGHLDDTQPVDGKLKLQGWHLSSRQKAGNYHWLILMDKSAGKELTRWNVTADSFKASNDVKKVYSDSRWIQSSSCRFLSTVEVADKFKGKKCYIKSRYCTDKEGNNGVTGEYDFKDTLIFL